MSVFKLYSALVPLSLKNARNGKDSEETKTTVKTIGWPLIKRIHVSLHASRSGNYLS